MNAKQKTIQQKGQVSSVDVLAAAIIFMLIFVSMRGIWVNNLTNAQKDFSATEQQLKALAALEVLLKTPGYPENWGAGNVEVAGLAKKPLVLDEKKVAAFALMDYNKAADIMGISGYEFFFQLSAQNPANNVSFGVPVSGDTERTAFTRTVFYKGGVASVSFTVFTD